MPGKVHIVTHGCQMNEYDSSRMLDLLRVHEQLTPTEDVGEADVLLLNTCSVREKAQEKVFHQLGRWRQLKQERPDLLIGVGGCVASQEGEAIARRAPYVDFVFGPQTLHRLPELIAARRVARQHSRKAPVQVDISFPEIEKFDRLPAPKVDGPNAFLSIMEGCSKFCTFCVVPYTRGPEVSRPLEDVLVEVEQLTRQGVREITFLGQNVNAYRGKTKDGGTADLAELILHSAKFPAIRRLRYTTSHPVEFSQNLIDVYAQTTKLVSHIHLPVQSGSDRILAAMKRGHTILEYKSKIKKLRALRPELSLSSDFIVGFPGESDQDFAATMNLIAELRFDASFSFLYSPRPGTPASDLRDQTDDAVKRQRLLLLQERLRQQAFAISQTRVGTRQQILVTGRSEREPSQLQGRAEDNRIVNFVSADEGLRGHYVNVDIRAALPNSLLAEFVSYAE